MKKIRIHKESRMMPAREEMMIRHIQKNIYMTKNFLRAINL